MLRQTRKIRKNLKKTEYDHPCISETSSLLFWWRKIWPSVNPYPYMGKKRYSSFSKSTTGISELLSLLLCISRIRRIIHALSAGSEYRYDEYLLWGTSKRISRQENPYCYGSGRVAQGKRPYPSWCCYSLVSAVILTRIESCWKALAMVTKRGHTQ